MKITERRIVVQEWYETENTKTGWDSNGWVFEDDYQGLISNWTVVLYIDFDKHNKPTRGIAEKETEI